MVSVAHHDEWRASTSVPKICKAYWHDSGSSLKPTGCELHRAIFSYLDAQQEVLASSPVCSNSQLGLIGGLQERVQRYLSAFVAPLCSPNLFRCLQQFIRKTQMLFFWSPAFEISMPRTRPGGLAVHMWHPDSGSCSTVQLRPLAVTSTRSYFLFCWLIRFYFTFQQARKWFLKEKKIKIKR